jgi:hypothetical protein
MALGTTLDDLGDFATTPNKTEARVETQSHGQTIIQQNVDDDFDTLNEHVCYTLLRDLKSIAQKTMYVLIPWRCSSEGKNRLKDWDLWGPLLLCLLLATCLAYTAGDNTKDGQAALIFAIVFIVIWVGSAVVTVNAVFLGSDKLGFFQSVCVLGYCCAPITIASFINAFPLPSWVKYLTGGIAFFWAMQAAVGFLWPVIPAGKRILALYPVFLFYLGLSWLVMAQ